MIEIRYNVFDEYERATLDEKICSVWISSSDKEESCNIVYNILTNVFKNSQVVFRSTEFSEMSNIDDVMEVIADCNPIYFEGEVKKKFFIEFPKRFPEVHAEISDKATLKNILDSWLSAVTEQRILYVLKEDKIDKVLDELRINIYKNIHLDVDGSHLSLLWPYLNCMVKSAEEEENHNTFILIFREEYLDKIKSLLPDS